METYACMLIVNCILSDHVLESIELNITSDLVPARGLHALYHSGRHTDVTFSVDGRTFKAHRLVVASQSAFFDR